MGKRISLPILFCVTLFCCSKSESPQPALRSLELRLAVPYELNNLDPHHRSTLSAFSLLSNFYETLVTSDAEMKIQPQLAVRWENPNSFTWIFHLDPAAKFSDGTSLTAGDVIYSFERLLANQSLETSAYLSGVVKVSAIDSRTVQVQTSQPSAIFLNRVRFVPIIRQGLSTDALEKKVLGTGPFVLAEWKPDALLRIHKNTKYWGKKPEVESVTYYLDRRPEEALRMIQAGHCEFAQYNRKDADAKISSEKQLQVLKRPNLFLKFLSMDLVRQKTPHCTVYPNPLLNRLVRQAIHLGIDRTALINAVLTDGLPAIQPVPSFVFGFNPEISSPVHDIQKAKDFLREAGLPNGFPITLHTRNIFHNEAIELKKQLKRIGIQLTLTILPDSEYFVIRDRGETTLALDQFGSSTGDAGEVLDDAFHSTDKKYGYGRYNYGNYQNKEFDRAIESLNQVEKMESRRIRLATLMSQAMEELIWVPLYFDQDIYIVVKKLKWKPRIDSHIFAREFMLQSGL